MWAKMTSQLRYLITTPQCKLYDPVCRPHRVEFVSKLSSRALSSLTPCDPHFGHVFKALFNVLKTQTRSDGAVRRLSGLTRRKSTREYSSSTTQTIHYNLSPDVPKREGRKLFFDTHAVVRLLENNGFRIEQAEVIVNVLVQMTSSNMDVIYSDMVTKVQQEIMLQRVMSQIAAVKKDMIILEKSEFSTLLAENEKLKIQLLQLKIQLADIMNKLRSDNLLDMNLEKSRVKELKAEHGKKLLETRTEIMEMTAEHERHLTQTNMKIDTEVAGLKTMLESHKLDTIKYLAGSIFTCLTVVLGFYRIWM
ncbi:mitochondrial calcium uniporter regulator 1 [Periophthalmus magnuspinnatus]|uniref:mitochondrial calcium uniporter regulator 1 n=1 Tax=Periophthalmus magnuspinnatus TaxID=409849 RepID=UPI00145B615C|nr:mitochondrial calcium uniporter regulator 1 [Periophthalmus magnuspinnatus]